MEIKKYWWVTGNPQKGFRILTKKPKTKNVPEPLFGTKTDVQRWIALQYFLNA
jgi:hypothetical protein